MSRTFLIISLEFFVLPGQGLTQFGALRRPLPPNQVSRGTLGTGCGALEELPGQLPGDADITTGVLELGVPKEIAS